LAISTGTRDELEELTTTMRLLRPRVPTALASALIAGLLAIGSVAAWAADAHPVRTERVSIRSSRPPADDSPLAMQTDTPPVADHIVVRKSERRMYLMRGNTVLRTYKIALGLNPVGQKERSGDFRTPEGRYYLTRRNPRSDYFLSIQVSYPNESDIQRARRHRWDAGGSIMIHGLPNHLRRPPEYYEKYDWTDGCIAVSDSDMVEIWLMTGEHTPIDILP
jgi:murein L,D-transpeptidase YafK